MDNEKGKSEFPYPYIYGSPLHLRQIFLNIYGNCIKYNRPGGKVTTVVESLGDRDGICTYRWTISDTGIGMSPEFLEHIFDPFAQEKTDARSYYQGTGLGIRLLLIYIHAHLAFKQGNRGLLLVKAPHVEDRSKDSDSQLSAIDHERTTFIMLHLEIALALQLHLSRAFLRETANLSVPIFR